ncbi:hypothetical protein FHS79_000101 [Polymorphobacter multimanifer]|uniref:Guanylate cyclase domain-containing protein n=1 Tax=Polymorphobacter multimanifer TaxID=1070431 RepID=A0A841L0M0_9SPHN|nr:hypothetical protein [Polymorphobacter multimanifer]MBB6225950.1 hypothetical protein [Polymorphobacter multimanifer]
MLNEILEAYRRSGRFVRACPWVVLAAVAVELAQHAAEISLGIYDSKAQAQAMEGAPLRMGISHGKVLVLALLGYAVARFLAFDDDARAAVRLEPAAMRLFGWVLAFGALWTVIGLDGRPMLMALGVDGRTAGIAVAVVAVVGFVLQVMLAPWKIAAPLGNPAIGFTRSIALAWRHLPWGLGFVLLAVLPVMALHYALFLGAIGHGRAVAWVMATLDALVVGYLGVLLIAVEYVFARRAAAANGESLLPAAEMTVGVAA